MGNLNKQAKLTNASANQQEEYELNDREMNLILENTSLNKQQVIEIYSKFRVIFLSFYFFVAFI